MVKNEVLGRIRNFGGYGSICLGLEINLAGSAKFLPPDFHTSKFYPPTSTYISSVWASQIEKILDFLDFHVCIFNIFIVLFILCIIIVLITMMIRWE